MSKSHREESLKHARGFRFTTKIASIITKRTTEPNEKNHKEEEEKKEMEIHERFLIEKRIGGGSFGQVFLARDNEKNLEKVVLKKIVFSTTEQENSVDMEMEAGRVLVHPHLVRVKESFKRKNRGYIMMEFVNGTDLFSLLENDRFKTIKDMKSFMRKLAKAILFCHKKGFAHMDIKLENVLVDDKGEPKLIDFGLCRKWKSNGRLAENWSGSPDYACPEILLRKPYQSNKADVFSLGVLFFILISKELPFGREERYNSILQGNHPEFDSDHNSHLPKEFRNLMEIMLNCNQDSRADMEQVVNHSFFKKSR